VAEVTALVPMRHASERVPGKNFRPLAGRPLFHWVLDMLLSCPVVGDVVVDTDSNVIRDHAARNFPSVRLLRRPAHLCGGDVAMNDVLANTLAQLPGELFLQTHATNPLLRADTVARAVELFVAGRPGHDSLFGVTRRHVRLWDAAGRPLNHDPAVLLRTQDLPPVFEENSCLYLFSRDVFIARVNRLGARPLMFEIDAEEALDVDEEFDLAVAESLVARRLGHGG